VLGLPKDFVVCLRLFRVRLFWVMGLAHIFGRVVTHTPQGLCGYVPIELYLAIKVGSAYATDSELGYFP
jgi:hypothetical protein